MATKPDWYYRQSALIPYRWGTAGLEVLVVTNRSSTRWIVPKGIVEKDMTPAESAAKEAYEEAGVRGKPDKKMLGTYALRKWGSGCDVEVFSMEVEEELNAWPEKSFRLRRWMPLRQAAATVSPPEVAQLITAMGERLEARQAKQAQEAS